MSKYEIRVIVGDTLVKEEVLADNIESFENINRTIFSDNNYSTGWAYKFVKSYPSDKIIIDNVINITQSQKNE